MESAAKRSILVFIGICLALVFAPRAWADDESLVAQRSFTRISKEVELVSASAAPDLLAGSVHFSSGEEGSAVNARAVLASDPTSGASDQWQRTGTCEWMIDDAYCLRIRPADGSDRGALRGGTQSDPTPWVRPWEESAKFILTIDLEGPIELWDGDSPFAGCTNLRSIAHLENLDTKNRTSMAGFFSECCMLSELRSLSFDTARVTDMSDMFSGCSMLSSLELSAFDTSNVTTMAGMFKGCSRLETIDVSSFVTGDVRDMSAIFSDCSNLGAIDLAAWNTAQVTDMSEMFRYCEQLTSVDLSSFRTGAVTDMREMFCCCGALASLDLSAFDTRAVTDMSYMFYCCGVRELDLSSFDITSVTDAFWMISACDELRCLDISSFDTRHLEDVELFRSNLFDKLSKVVVGVNFTLQYQLPAPRPCNYMGEYVINEGADGGWYNRAGFRFAPSQMPLGVADSYYATRQLAEDAANGKEPDFSDDQDRSMREVTVEVEGGHGTTSPAPGIYTTGRSEGFIIGFIPDDGYVPYRIWVDGVQSFVSPTLSGWALPASWSDQTFKVQFALADANSGPNNDGTSGGRPVISIENLIYVKDVAQLNIFINGNLSVSIPEVSFDGAAVRPLIVIAPMLTSEQIAELDLPKEANDIAVYRYALSTIDGAHPDVAEVVTFGADGNCLTTNFFARFDSAQDANDFVARVRSDYGSNFLKGSVDGETAHVQVSMVDSRLDKAAYEARLSEVVEGLERGPVEGEDYIVTYADNEKPGLATVTVTGKGEYYGTQTAQFRIVEPSNAAGDSGDGLTGSVAGTAITGSTGGNGSKVTSGTTPLVQTGASAAGSSTAGKTGLVQTGDMVGHGAALLAVLAAVSAIVMVVRRRSGAPAAAVAPAVPVPVFVPRAPRMPAPPMPFPKKLRVSGISRSCGAGSNGSTGAMPSVSLSPKMTCDVICSLDDVFERSMTKPR